MQKPHNRRRWKRPRRAPGAARDVPKEELAEVREVVVLDGSRSERSLAFVMEDGGLRRLVFFEGLEGKEAPALVGAFLRSVARIVDTDARARSPGDLVALL